VLLDLEGPYPDTRNIAAIEPLKDLAERMTEKDEENENRGKHDEWPKDCREVHPPHHFRPHNSSGTPAGGTLADQIAWKN
jgi:hypothetical protein